MAKKANTIDREKNRDQEALQTKNSDPNQQVGETEKVSIRKDQDPAGATDEKAALEARVQSLKQTIFALKSELLEEKALWRKEVDLMTTFISSSSDRPLESDLTSEPEVDMKSVMSTPLVAPDPVATTPLIRDYEEKLNRYQGALAQAQAEKRLSIRRQIAANTYRKRLNEVEKLCQEELDKVRETATYLEPLKQIASEWGKVKQHYVEPLKSPLGEKPRRRTSSSVECGGDFLPSRGKEVQQQQQQQQQEEEDSGAYEVPVKQIDASLVMDEDASNEIKGKIVLQIGSLPTEVPTICYSAKFE